MKTLFLDTSDLSDSEIYLELVKTAEGNPEKGLVPAYYFNICAASAETIGHCDLRIGHNEKLYYGGNIGYSVESAFRGRRYAAKACRLLFQLAKKHGLEYLIITCNPENTASRRTCEILDGKLLETADLPPDNDMHLEGERQKCIYRFEL